MPSIAPSGTLIGPRRLLAGVVLLLVAALTGCTATSTPSGDGPETSTASAGDQASPAATADADPTATDPTATETSTGAATGDTLTVHTSFVLQTLDPGRVYEATGLLALHGVYETLMTFEGSDVSEPVPLLAESIEASEDAREFTVTLRDGATFADGSSVELDDVLFSLNRLKNLQASPSVIIDGLSFEAGDDGTLVITSERPNPDVPTILAMPSTGILNAELAREQGATDATDAAETDDATSWLDQNSVGSGPYVLARSEPSSEVVLEANEDYWGDPAAFPRVVIRNTDVQNQQLTIQRAEAATVALDLSGRLLDDLPDHLGVSGAQDTFYFLYLHADPEVSETSSDPDIVAALRAAIDYQGVAQLFGEDAAPAPGVVPPAFAGALPAEEAPTQDLQAATDLVAASGIDDPTLELVYPAITYRGVDLGTIATKISTDAAQAGLTLELTPQPITQFLESQGGGELPLGLTPQSLNYPVAASLVNNMAPGQSTAMRSGWTEERADPEVIDAATSVLEATDVDARLAALQDWQRAMNEHSPFIPFATNSGTVVATDDLTGADYSPAGWILDLAAVSPAG